MAGTSAKHTLMPSETLQLFIRWFVVPFHMLKQLNHGDGAFVAFTIGFSLCERFHRIESTSQDRWRDDSFMQYAARHLDVEKSFFEDFWDVFRNGIQHQASPKWRAGDGNARKPYKWAIDATYPAKPVLGRNKRGEDVICINPWAFTEHYINLFLGSPQLLKEAVHHSFGNVVESGSMHDLRELRYGASREPITNNNAA